MSWLKRQTLILSRSSISLRSFLINWIQKSADPVFASFFRVSLCTLFLLQACWMLYFVPLLWYPREGSELNYIFILHGIWILVILLNLIGVAGLFMRLAHYLLALYLMDYENSGRTMGEFLLLVAALWYIWVPSHTHLVAPGVWKSTILRFLATRQNARSVRAWPFFLMGINLGILILMTGITKSYDPKWRYGDGFYYTFLLPWFRSPAYSFLLDQRWLMLFMNYATLLFELSFLFLFAFIKLRPLALLMSTLFFLQLTYPFRIHFIGPAGLVLCLGLFSITPFYLNWLRKLIPAIPAPAEDIPQEKSVKSNTRVRRWHGELAFVGFSLIFMGYCGWRSFELVPVRYPHLLWPVTSVQGQPESPFIPLAPPEPISSVGDTGGTVISANKASDRSRQLRRRIRKSIWMLNRHTTKIRTLNMFGSWHLIGIYVFRVQIDLEDGTVLEPMPGFNDGMEPLFYIKGPVPRHFQARMYLYSWTVHNFKGQEKYKPKPYEVDLFSGMAVFNLTRLNAEERIKARRVRIIMRPILVPAKYEGNVKPWADEPWYDIFYYDIPTRTSVFTPNKIPPYPLPPMKVEGTKDSWYAFGPFPKR